MVAVDLKSEEEEEEEGRRVVGRSRMVVRYY
jgi:hypothetical protein